MRPTATASEDPQSFRDLAAIDEVLARLSEGRAADEELLACARWAALDPERMAYVKSRWPTGKLPVIDNYYCVKRLGQGASGDVFKALAVRTTPEFVALKLLRFGSEEAEQRFHAREVAILKAINCPYVGHYLDSGTAGGTTYLAMELVQGQPLDEYLEQHAPTLEEKLIVFRRACEIVAGLHAEGVIHRDLNPKHVLVDKQGQPWIVDFGISAVRSDQWSTHVRRAQTQLGRILGTFKYMSPEQAWGGLKNIGRRTDIWSLGVMLFEITTGGDHPYNMGPMAESTGSDSLLHRIQTETPKKPRIASPQYAEALETLISRCLVFDPNQRIDSAEDLASDLARCLAQQSIQTKRLPMRHRLQRIAVGLAVRRRFGLWSVTVCAVLLFLLGVSLVFGVRWRASGSDYSGSTRRFLLSSAAGTRLDDIAIVGISEDTLDVVPAEARHLGISDVTRDITSWRAVHGALMEKFAHARPRAVVWDYYFPAPRTGDSEFVRGVRALQRADVPVVLAVRSYRSDGSPDLSPGLEPIAAVARHGLILAYDPQNYGAELVLALRRGETAYPALILSAFAAIVHPDSRMALDWQDHGKTVRVTYHPYSAGDRIPSVDRVGLTTVVTKRGAQVGTLPGDLLGCKAFSLQRPHYWEGRTVPYEKLLQAEAAEVAAEVEGKILIVGDLRPRSLFRMHDRHRVRYGNEVKDVPGCYLLADGLTGLLNNRYLKSETPPTPIAFAGVVLFAFIACALPQKLSLYKRMQSRRTRVTVVAALLAAGLAGTLALIRSHSQLGVYASMVGTALCLAFAASLVVEFTRSRYRVPDLLRPTHHELRRPNQVPASATMRREQPLRTGKSW